MCLIYRILLSAIMTVGLLQSAYAERRVALVIGNAAYRFVSPLKNSTEDANHVAQLLKRMDFDVTVGLDLDKIAMEATIRHFSESLAGADVALFYYSGHAVQVDERNYIIPVSAVASNQLNTTLDAVALQDISQLLQVAGVKTSFLFLDACRNNPFSNMTATRALGTSRGLARVTTTTGSLVVFSTSPGNVAFDGNGNLSPFTEAFVRYASVPRLEIRQMLSRVRADVAEKTNNQQIPWDSSSLIGDFYLVPRRPPPTFERNVSVRIETNGTAQPLHLAAPVQPEGGDIKIRLRSLPNKGTLLLNSSPLTLADEISASQFTQIYYEPAKHAVLADAFGFEVDDAWGNSEAGLVSLVNGEPTQIVETPVHADLGVIEAKAVSLIGLGPNLIFTHAAEFPADAAQTRVQLASNLPFGQLMIGSRVIEVGRSIELSELAKLAFNPPAGTDGRQVQAVFKPADIETGEVRVAVDVRMTDCDRLAGARLDPQGASDGVLTGLIDTKSALPACETAVKARPQIARYSYELGRVLAALGRSAEAAGLYQHAADLGHIRARHELGYIYTYGAGVPVDLERGRKELERAVADGDIFAIQTLGMLYYEGRGVDRDFSRARGLFEQAARAGHTYAMNSLGRMYQRGDGVAVDPETTRRYWEESAARNDMYGIGNLGHVYLEGIAADKDPSKAMNYFKRASDMGHPLAPNDIGRMYFLGLGVAVDNAAARKWYTIGADRGDGWASFNLAEMNRLGHGEPADQVRAMLYYARAAALNTLEPANLSRKQLEISSRRDKLEALSLVVAKLEPQLKPPSSEALLLAEAKRITVKHSEKPADETLDAVLIAAARVEWQSLNVRTDLF
jgi:TPR repeat protein